MEGGVSVAAAAGGRTDSTPSLERAVVEIASAIPGQAPFSVTRRPNSDMVSDFREGGPHDDAAVSLGWPVPAALTQPAYCAGPRPCFAAPQGRITRQRSCPLGMAVSASMYS
jgi:hypothetical protein